MGGGFLFMDFYLEIIARLDRIERMLVERGERRQIDPDILPWRVVAVKLGLEGKAPALAARQRVHRARNAGAAMRVTRNGVNSKDFARWIASCEAAHPSLADKVRRALEGIER